MAIHTGINAIVVVCGTTVSGCSGSLIECSLTIGKERGKFNKIGCASPEVITGMKEVSGTLRRKWVSGDQLFYNLLNNDTSFNVTAQQITAGNTMTACGCLATSLTRRLAPGSEVQIEELTIMGIDFAES